MGNDGFLYYAMHCTHYTGTGTGNHRFLLFPVPVPVQCVLAIMMGPAYNEFDYNERSATASRFLCIKVTDWNVEKFGYNEHPFTASRFLCFKITDSSNVKTTGWERLIRSHSSARFCFELSGNSN